VDLDLIVVGGGPVGASLARAVRGLKVALLARARRAVATSYEQFDARVYALSPGNVQFLRQIGAMPQARATPVHAMRIYGDGASHLEFDAYRAGVPELAWIVEDAVLQDELWREVGFEVAPPPESMEVESGKVVLRLAGGRVLSAPLVVGADGARSFVRERAGIEASEKAYGQSAVVANFACERAHANTAFQWFQGGPVLALLPLPGNHVSMVWSLPAAHAERIGALEPEPLCRALEAATRGALGQLSLVTAPRSYLLSRLSARRLVAPRIALVGDAAHVIHPLAGQGLNLGLQDARALAQVLEQRGPLRDLGEPRLLRRYERSRAQPILAMDATVNGLYTLFGTHNRLTVLLRNAGLNLTDRIPVLKNLLIRQALN
jgi:ubiquinone biosynthesis UbiH/UbiF/VisC/COQ6 family hydroxylase